MTKKSNDDVSKFRFTKLYAESGFRNGLLFGSLGGQYWIHQPYYSRLIDYATNKNPMETMISHSLEDTFGESPERISRKRQLIAIPTIVPGMFQILDLTAGLIAALIGAVIGLITDTLNALNSKIDDSSKKISAQLPKEGSD